MQIRITRLEHGWAELRISHGTQQGTILASQIRDFPAELLSALTHLLQGAKEERVIFEGEPGYSVMRFRQLSGDLVRIEVSGGPSEDDDPEKVPWFRHTEPLPRFARRVYAEFERLLSELGPVGYQKRWGANGFPLDTFIALGQLLAETR